MLTSEIDENLTLAVLGVVATQANATVVNNVSAQALDNQSVRVTWDAAPSSAYYELYMDSVRVQTGIEENAYTVSELLADTQYQFFVTACQENGVCSDASAQSSALTTELPTASAVCDDRDQLPLVSLSDVSVEDGTAVLSWCAVSDAEGYNLYLNDRYQSSVSADTLELTVSFSGSEQYQVAWYANGNYPAKSAVALVAPQPVTPPSQPETEGDVLARLDTASNSNMNDVEIYFTRHAEKEVLMEEQADGSLTPVCGESKCGEVLNAKGELRAELLAQSFSEAGITDRLTHAFSSHKIRTRQTIEQIVAEAGLMGDIDKFPNDGIQEFPVYSDNGVDFATELSPESTTPSEAPVIEALLNLPAGSVALVAGHSGTLYDIMAGLGLTDVCVSGAEETCSEARYPVNSTMKVKNFGDIWKITLEDGEANFVYRVNVQPSVLVIDELAR